MMKRAITKLFILTFFISLITVQPSSQPVRGLGRLSGRVVDEANIPIAKAVIIVESLEREKYSRTVTADNKGNWKILGLGSGYYKIKASAPGYLPTTKNIKVSQIERNPSLTLVLKRAEKVVAQDEGSLELFEKGNKLFEEKKYDEALESFKQFLENNPQAYQIHFNIGNCYKEKNELEQAKAEFELVIKKAQEEETAETIKLQAKALAGIGEIYLKREDLEKAQKYFKQSLGLSPNDEILAYNVGEIYFSNNKMDEAVEYFKLASQIKPSWPDPYLKLGYVYLNKGENDKALEILEKFLELEPDSARSSNVKNIIEYLKKK